MSEHVSVDFETFYIKGEYDSDTYGIFNYVTHERFDAYLVALYDNKGINCAVNPKSFNWDTINGKLWTSFNMGFDRVVFWRLKQLGIVPKHIKPSAWKCTQQLSLYTCGAGSLAEASRLLLGKEMSKEMRDYMNRKTWEDAVVAGKDKELIEYARLDAEHDWHIWEQYSETWPKQEQQLGEMVVKQGFRGVYIDQPKIKEYIQIAKTKAIQAVEALPWINDEYIDITNSDHVLEKGDEWESQPKTWTKVRKKFKKDDGKIPGYGDRTDLWPSVAFRKVILGKPPLSYDALEAECIKYGLTPPPSFDEKTKEYQEFEEKYGDKHEFIKNFRTYKKGNKLVKKFQLMQRRIKPDGYMPYSIKYHGAHTGRDSTMGKWNPKNQTKDNSHFPEINERSLIIAPPGKTLAILDYAAIEARVLAWVVGDTEMLALMAKMSPYESFARSKMGWKGGDLKKENKKMYDGCKASVLGGGYSMGWERFIDSLPIYKMKAEEILGDKRTPKDEADFKAWNDRFEKGRRDNERFDKQDELTKNIWTNALKCILLYRQANPGVVQHWKDLGERFENCEGETFELILPSWRSLKYHQIVNKNDQFWASRGSKESKYYGGKLTENECQAIARDVLVEAKLKVDAAGFPVILDTYDELVCEVDLEKAQEQFNAIKAMMEECPKWLTGCPLSVEGELSPYYKK